MINLDLDYNILTETFRSGCKKPSDLQVGVEWEKIGILKDTGRAIPYSGPRGVQAIFGALAARYGWIPVNARDGRPVALKKGPVSITLEPGGQIELSGQKAAYLADNAAELHLHLSELREVSDPLGIAWLGIGAQPFSRHEEIEWTPKDRYNVMRESLKGQGSRTFKMMKETASVQVSLDYTSEKDAVEKLRLAMALSPVLTAMFANSPLEGGQSSPYLSRRAHIWLDTDPGRSGIIWDAFRDGFSFEDYARYALEVPILFIEREGEWLAPPRMPFSEFLKNGWSGHEPVRADWELHLTSIFTEARLKTYLEIRSIDCQNVSVGIAAVAFLKGIFYDETARREAWKIMDGVTIEERKALQQEAPRLALKTPFKGKTLLEAARTLTELAEKGLAKEEKGFLIALKENLAKGRCPAEKLLECDCGAADDLRTKIDRLVACAAI